MNKKISVLIVDNHEIMRQGLISVFEQEDEIEVIGEANNGEDALTGAAELSPDIILMDIKMPKMDGIAATELIKHRYPEIKIIILTAIDSEGDIFKAIEAGVDGYIVKDASSTEIIRATKLVASGDKYLHPSAVRKVMEEIKSPAGAGENDLNGLHLTERELSVLELMAKGYKNRAIAAQLFLGEETVKTHVSNILNKLKQPDRVQAVFYALRCGLIKINK
ncbi:MAG TPA: response regulator transcription factor [Actinobacteria bacterium]|nr:response regulator transcription factor [Actinomycetes bacterium]HEX21056.1 response regulator transcription factor [Actinomycetota bacterium]